MRRVAGLVSLLALAVVLVACGGDSSEDEPTVVPTVADMPTTAAIATAPADTGVSPAAASPATDASPTASPASTPVASPVASPLLGTPVASPVASPFASPVASPVMATPVARTVWQLEGTVFLPGSPNEHFVIGDDGCVGLGDYAGVSAGQQVVVRDSSGTIMGLTTLADGGSANECIWTFAVEVPVSDFYTVSLPLIYERAYSDADLAVMDGRLQITLP